MGQNDVDLRGTRSPCAAIWMTASNDGGLQITAVAPVFAGMPGKANCDGQSVSALAQQYGGLNNAAAALGFDSVKALQEATQEFCAS